MVLVPIVQKDSHNEMWCFHGISLIGHDKGNVIFLPVMGVEALPRPWGRGQGRGGVAKAVGAWPWP